MKCLAAPSPSTMSGLLDAILSPGKTADAWLAQQRAAVSGDVAYQRATLVAQMRQVASEATTEAAVKLSIAGVVTFAVCAIAYRLATREG